MTDDYDPLAILGTLASHLDSPEFVDETSAKERRLLRKAADEFQAALERATGGPVTASILVAFCSGASTQATMEVSSAGLMGQLMANAGLGPKAEMDGRLAVVVAYLARDVLAGERVG